jgi:hypothetical protein
MHHFNPLELTQFLKESYEVSRCGIVMSDLIRGRAPLWAFRLLRPVFARHPFTYHDGSLSVRRAYLPQELLNLVKEAGLPNPQVFCHFPWRMTLVVEK